MRRTSHPVSPCPNIFSARPSLQRAGTCLPVTGN